jgi:hypothetical protein
MGMIGKRKNKTQRKLRASSLRELQLGTYFGFF